MIIKDSEGFWSAVYVLIVGILLLEVGNYYEGGDERVLGRWGYY
jgi:hypothetical protein